MFLMPPTMLYFYFAVAGLFTNIKKIKLKNILHKFPPPTEDHIYNSQILNMCK